MEKEDLRKVKIVIFDCWNTLVQGDQKELERYRNLEIIYSFVREKDKVSYQEFVKFCVDFLTEYYSTALYEITSDQMLNYILATLGLTLTKSVSFVLDYETSLLKVSPVPGSNEFLTYLEKASLPYFVVSNTIHSEKTTRRFIENTHPEHVFSDVFVSSFYGVRKPDRRLFELALHKKGIKAEDALYIGDTFKDDVMGADSAGIKAIYLNIRNREKPLGSGHCDFLEVHSYEELITLFKEARE